MVYTVLSITSLLASANVHGQQPGSLQWNQAVAEQLTGDASNGDELISVGYDKDGLPVTFVLANRVV